VILGRGMPVAAVASRLPRVGIGSILMGLLSNYPLALAPGMGLNATSPIRWSRVWACLADGAGVVFLSGVAFSF